ncbi:polysaccharide deacetylase family protein [Alkalicoccus urumqiensis]|uniref:polysaccharide deacetylase family protein n=1 Tax=Alkalicoccus urumqiensis TaxID=1548213 RepID=UPI0015E61061|nr:polysaccharide deacetylase family protein [Alkalicoccus urumqiensis]
MKRFMAAVLAGLMLFGAAGIVHPEEAEAARSNWVTKGTTTEKVVALTFDDGADGTNLPIILDVLDEYNVTSTFFLTGSGMRHHPDMIRRIAAEGHEVANHSDTHPDFTTLSASQIRQELQRTETLAVELTGQSTKPLFRAPFGAVNNAVLDAVGDAGYTHTLHWNIDTIDWRGPSKNEIVDKVVSNIVPGSIVLMHTGAGAPGTPYALPDMIQELDARGYRFVTIGEMFGTAGVTIESTYTVKSGDTLYGIAQTFGTTTEKLRLWNGLSGDGLTAGQTLIVRKITFTDITNHWAKDSIIAMTKQGLTAGRTATTFVPNGPVTRAESAVLLTRLFQLNTSGVREPFTDVAAGSWYTPGIAAAYEADLIAGYRTSSGSLVFRPGQEITRQEMAALLVRAAETRGGVSPPASSKVFADESAISSWAAGSVKKAVGSGLMSGRTSTTFAPGENMTRAEMTVVLQRMQAKGYTD